MSIKHKRDFYFLEHFQLIATIHPLLLILFLLFISLFFNFSFFFNCCSVETVSRI